MLFGFSLSIPLSRYSTFNEENVPCFCGVCFIQETGIIDSVEAWWILLQCHISFDLKQIALQFQKPLAGEKPSFISNVFRILQNNWLPWKLLVKCQNMDIFMITIA